VQSSVAVKAGSSRAFSYAVRSVPARKACGVWPRRSAARHHQWQTDGGQKLIASLPRKRVGEPKDLDTALMMLCANESHFINGAVLAADDGYGL
jgi:hypothetical protein